MSLRDRPDLVGVLGGMGPLATADFITKLIAMTPAERDDDHVPLIVCSCPQLPPRAASILDTHARSPLPELKERLDLLLTAGAKCIVMPYNTAHYWHGALAEAARPVPFIHIADAAADELARRKLSGTVGLIATEGTFKAGFYQERLAAHGFPCALPSDAVTRSLVLPAIAHVKANRVAEAEPMFREAVRRVMAESGAKAVILACTEVPVALSIADPWVRAHCIDATEALAKATLEWALAARQASKSSPKAR